jgi:hypothetical protein
MLTERGGLPVKWVQEMGRREQRVDVKMESEGLWGGRKGLHSYPLKTKVEQACMAICAASTTSSNIPDPKKGGTSFAKRAGSP